MFVKVKRKGTVYYDPEQKKNIDDKRIYEVKATGLIRDLLRTGDLSETEKPSKAILDGYAKEDKEIEGRKAASAEKLQKAKPLDGQVKSLKTDLGKVQVELDTTKEELGKAGEELVEANEALVLANTKIADLEEQLLKVGDPKSVEALAAAKKNGTDVKKETASAGGDK